MRLWTVHPKYLDARGLVALWREALLAQKVLQGRTKGYKHHPQLIRFRACSDPVVAIFTYLWAVHDEATKRGYCFDATKIGTTRTRLRISETAGQLLYEWEHLKRKLRERDPETMKRIIGAKKPKAHPLFRIVAGEVREWEVV